MIPKQIFFIWIGDNKPNYVDFVINAFKKVNFDFNIELIHHKTIDKNNIDIKECLDLINTKNTFYYNMYNRKFSIKHCPDNIRFSDCFRFYILNKYGGIYLDCDTFPIKPFDNYILDKNILFTQSIDPIKKCKIYDIFFIAMESGKLKDNFYKPFNYENARKVSGVYVYKQMCYHTTTILKNKAPDSFKKQTQQFYNLELSIVINENSPYYFNHYRYLSWKNK